VTFTYIRYNPVEAGVKVQFHAFAPETEAKFSYHWYMYGAVPPETEDVKV
jgi:hypothetical protein